MAAQDQCDQPHVLSDDWRNGPAKASASCPKYTPGMTSSDMDMDISSPRCIFDSESLTLKPSPMSSGPSSSSQATDATEGRSRVDSIDMPSNTLSFGTSSSSLPDLPHAQIVTHEDVAHIISLEREVCQNYNCCGVHLADLHALLSHFDRNHVSVVAPGGKRIFPPVGPATPSPSMSQSSPSPASTSPTSSTVSSSSRSSSAECSPPPETPMTPASLLLDPMSSPPPDILMDYSPYSSLALSFGSVENSLDDPQPFSYDVMSGFGPEYDFTKDYACYKLAYSEKVKRKHLEEQREQDEKQGHAGESLELGADSATLMSSTASVERLKQEDDTSRLSPCPSPSSSTGASDSHPDSSSNGTQPDLAPLKKSQSRKDTSSTNNGGKVPKLKIKSTSASNARNPLSSMGRKREKTFKCPRQGCTKSYLNPNGLKYHVEKGTCKFDGPEGCSSGSSSPDTSPSSPIEPQSSVVTSPITSSSPPLSTPTSTSGLQNSPPIAHLQPVVSAPSAFYGPFPSTMSPQEVYQSVIHAALSSTAASLALNQAEEQGPLCSSSTSEPAVTPKRGQSAPGPVSSQVPSEPPVDASPVPQVAPALRHSATTYVHLGQGQLASSSM